MPSRVASVSDLETPALIVEIDGFARNIAQAENMLKTTRKLLRPHVKTHRTPGLALRQLGPHAKGITCATVAEAEVMAAAGIGDILLANEVATAGKMKRLACLAAQVKITVAVDSPETIPLLAAETAAQGATIHVLADIDVGLGRCGVRDAAEAVAIARLAAGTPGLAFAGIMGYEGRLRGQASDRSGRFSRAVARLAEAKGSIEEAGLEVQVVSGGGTSTLVDHLQQPVLTEIQAGTYALMEHDLDDLHLPFGLCAYVLGTVISRTRGIAVVDVGRKSIGCDYGPPLAMHDEARTQTVSEEHTVISFSRKTPSVGERLKLRPSQIRTTFNLHDVVWLAKGDAVMGRLPVSARGKSQ